MKTIKHYCRKIPALRWLDDWTDTPCGENICYTIIVIAVLLWFAARNIKAV